MQQDFDDILTKPESQNPQPTASVNIQVHPGFECFFNRHVSAKQLSFTECYNRVFKGSFEMDRLTTPISSWLPILARKEKQIEEFQRRLDPAENVYIGVKDLQQNKIHLLKQVQEEKKKLECMRDQLAVYRRLNQELLHECRDRFRRMEEERAEMEKKNKEKFV